MSSFTSSIQHSTGSPNHSKQMRRNKRHPNWKGRSNTSIFADDMKLYIENPKDSTKKLPELINEFSKVAVYKISIQKSVVFLYTNELSEREIKKTIPFTVAPKKKKNLEINLTKNVKDLCSQNYNTEERN